MVGLLTRKQAGPIGLDLGSRCVKLVQLSHDRTSVVEASRWDLPTDAVPGTPGFMAGLADALRQAREGRKFRGRDVVLCLGARELFVQNLRVTKPAAPGATVEPQVREEAATRLPFPLTETELRFLEVADVRQGEALRREVIMLACHRPVLDGMLQVIDDAGLKPTAVEVEPLVLLRCYSSQFRRDLDQQLRTLYVHVGHSNTAVIIAQGSEVAFIKYIDLGGKHFDEAVARHLKMDLAEAWALRRHNGDRRADQQDPEVARSVAESLRPVLERLAAEVLLCVRYHSVTFRGQPLQRLVLGGGEATPGLVDSLAGRLDLKCELGDPARAFESATLAGRKSQWDVAIGLALRPTE